MLKKTKDHYVSQTYLRRFSSSPEFAFGIRKKVKFNKEIPIDSICFERGGDICESFENKDGLKKLLRIIEPSWNIFIKSIEERNLVEIHTALSKENEISFLEKICCFMAYLRCNSPTQHRLMKEQLEGFATQYILPKVDKHLNINSSDDVKVIIGDRDYYKGQAINILKDIPQLIYDKNWTLLVNDSNTKFITSDNPFISLGDGSLYLPLTPSYALVIESAVGNSIVYRKIQEEKVKSLNLEIIKFAEDFIVSSENNIEIDELVDLHRDYSASVIFASFNDVHTETVFFQQVAIKR